MNRPAAVGFPLPTPLLLGVEFMKHTRRLRDQATSSFCWTVSALDSDKEIQRAAWGMGRNTGVDFSKERKGQ